MEFLLSRRHLVVQDNDDIWRQGIRSTKKATVLREAHYGITGGHYGGDTSTWKIWQAGLWWPTTQRDTQQHFRECDLCQRLGQPTKRACMPHQPILPLEPFQKWGLDFVGPFTPVVARTGNRYILIVTDYCTKWVEAKPLRDDTVASTTKFLYEHIWCRFSCLIEPISDQGGNFLNEVIDGLTHYYTVIYKKNTPYYPQANSLAEFRNKTL